MSKAPLKVGVVGMGGIGNLHADCHKADELAELVAVCDLIKERADKAAERLGVPAYYSLKEMLKAHPDLDIVDVCTSGYENGSWHYEPTMEALDAGKHVLVEKPISNEITEAREMVAYAYKKGLYLGCNLNHYFSLPAERAKKYMDEGQIGEQVYCINKVGFNGSEAGYGGTGAPRWNRPYSHAKAFLTHPFSVMRYFCGNVTHVQAFMDKPGVRRSASDLMLSIQSIHMKFENGCVGYLLSQRGDAMFGLGGWWSFELAGTKGTFVIENCVEKLTYYKSGAEPEVMNTGITDFNSTFPRRIHAFLEDVSNGVPLDNLRSSGRDALATMEYIFAAIESYENGGEIVRPHPLPPIHGAVGSI
ncbi:MAG: Gfo/Idh/MocA family protein [Eubacteriales bacterium]|jgi:predicted dehydrogenase|nr:Gfo/Idh/MocA family oxidoreductase [Clostridiales bacterium]